MLAELYRSGLTEREIAFKTGIPKSTVHYRLVRAGVEFDSASRISAKAKGRPSPRKGAKHTPEARAAMSKTRKGRPSTTLGKVYSESERANIASGLIRHYAKLRAQGRLLSPEERAARNQIRNTAKRFIRRILTMTRKRKDARTEQLLGYTKTELRSHLESQFQLGMSWLHRDSFHIDHKTPVAWFLRNGITDIARINALSNLQILTPDENRKKSDSVLTAHFGNGKTTYTAGIA